MTTSATESSANQEATRRAPPPPRTGETVPLLRDNPMVPFTIPWQIRPPGHNLIVAIKATFELVNGQPAKLREEQPPPSGDIRHDGDGNASLLYASDYVIRKPKADVTLVGHAYPANKSGVSVVTLLVGRLKRTIVVFGDRTWGTLGAQSEAAAFDRMPLRWERAMGGPLSDINPLGRGFKTGVMLPNLELRETLVKSPRDVPQPACFAPVPPEWKSRMSKMGSFGGRWLKERWPFFPEDFDFAYFNAAPPEQQVPYLRGDEDYALHGVRPDKEVLAGQLAGVVPRLFAYTTADAGGAFVEVALNLDTVAFDADAGQVSLVWRGMMSVRDDEASDIAVLFATTSNVDQPLSPQEAFDRFVHAGSEAQLWPDPPVPLPEDPAQLPIKPAFPVGPVPPPTRSQVASWVAEGASFAGRDLTRVDFSGLDLTGVDLSGAILKGANLRGSTVKGASFAEAALTQVDADGVCFDGCDLHGADLHGARLREASFRKANLADSNFSFADASGSDFSEARSAGAVFARAILACCTFDGAELAKADFSNTRIDKSKWSGAQLNDARFYNTAGDGCVFDGASMNNARMDEAVLHGANFVKMKADDSVWERADLSESTLHSAQFNGANFTKAKLDRCVLSTAEGKAAFFRKASLRQAHLLKANLMQSNFEGADLTDADMRGANLYQVETWRAKMDGAKLELALVSGSKLAK